MNEPLVIVEGASKKFCRNLKRSLWYGLQDMGREITGRRHGGNGELRPQEFWAVRDVNFELRRGECLGLLGRNGAGKTTLLKMLNGLIKPDAGRIEMRGRIGALIALGAGFNPILSGRENIYVNGSVLGLRKAEIDARIDEIISFSEIGEFIDMPVQSYSSGMNVRLGFAVATSLQPDVLLLDEVLAVGDAAFRHKCYQRINRIIGNCAVIIVSHSMEQIAAVASKVGLLHKGSFALHHDVASGINAYNDINRSDDTADDGGDRLFAVHPPLTTAEVRFAAERVPYRGRLEVSVELHSTEPVRGLVVSFTGVNQNHQPVMNWNNRALGQPIDIAAGHTRLDFAVDPLLLHKGRYRWNLWVSDGGIDPLIYAMNAGSFVVESELQPVFDMPYLPDPSGLAVTTAGRTTVYRSTPVPAAPSAEEAAPIPQPAATATP
jgi:lipopolysaccharide transport system ATP-binding protein